MLVLLYYPQPSWQFRLHLPQESSPVASVPEQLFLGFTVLPILIFFCFTMWFATLKKITMKNIAQKWLFSLTK